MYQLIGNTPLPNNIKDDFQLWGDPTTQQVMLDDSSQVGSEVLKGVGLVSVYETGSNLSTIITFSGMYKKVHK